MGELRGASGVRGDSVVVGALVREGDLQERGLCGAAAARPACVQVRHQREASVGAPDRVGGGPEVFN